MFSLGTPGRERRGEPSGVTLLRDRTVSSGLALPGPPEQAPILAQQQPMGCVAPAGLKHFGWFSRLHRVSVPRVGSGFD
jgi:hypothetical protein